MRPPVAHAPLAHGALAYLAARPVGVARPNRLHAGIDLRGRPGTDVVAPEDCRVVYAFANADTAPPVRGWGWLGYGPAVVVVRGASGWFHLLGHLAPAPLPAVGSTLREGERIGRISTRAHCHWQVQSLDVPPRGSAYVEITCDPFAWLAGHPVMFDATTQGCPAFPSSDYHTPRGCRPGHAPVQPFPPPTPSVVTPAPAPAVATADEVTPPDPFALDQLDPAHDAPGGASHGC